MRRTLSGRRLVSKVLEYLSNPKFPTAVAPRLIFDRLGAFGYLAAWYSATRLGDNLEWRMQT